MNRNQELYPITIPLDSIHIPLKYGIGMGKHFVVWMIVPPWVKRTIPVSKWQKKLPGGQVLPRVVPGVDHIFFFSAGLQRRGDGRLEDARREILGDYIYTYILYIYKIFTILSLYIYILIYNVFLFQDDFLKIRAAPRKSTGNMTKSAGLALPAWYLRVLLTNHGNPLSSATVGKPI